MSRSSLSDFESRKGQNFEVISSDGPPLGPWKLLSIRPLPNPDPSEFGDIECFSLSFQYHSETPLTQDTYHLKSEDSFQVDLFAIPFRDNEMTVTFN